MVKQGKNGEGDESDSFVAGRLRRYSANWLNAPEALQKILRGYRIPFKRVPPAIKFSKIISKKFQTKPSPEMSLEIRKLIKSGALQNSHEKSGFLSTLFLKRKANGENRPILNLRRLNEFVASPRFRLINHFGIPSHIQRGDYMMKLDISQSYFHVPVSQSHRRYLSVAYQGAIYEMTCLPFGLASAPSAFAKITNWVAQQLREKGLRVLVYLDDFLFIHADHWNIK